MPIWAATVASDVGSSTLQMGSNLDCVVVSKNVSASKKTL